MSSDLQPESSASSLEDFLAGKMTGGPSQEDTGVVVPPAPEDGSAIEQIVANIRAELTHQVRSEETAVLPAGMTVRAHGNVGEFAYRPDLIVDAALPPAGSLSARKPRVVFEVAAAESERADFIRGWQIYRALQTLEIYVLVDSTRMAVTLHRRAGETWKTETFEDPDDQLFLPLIHCLLSLETIYAGIFPEEEN